MTDKKRDVFGGTPNTAVGPAVALLWRGKTTALPKIRGERRPFAVPVGGPRNRLSLNVIRTYSGIHARNLTISANTEKPTVGF
jgi:hypothetical protein